MINMEKLLVNVRLSDKWNSGYPLTASAIVKKLPKCSICGKILENGRNCYLYTKEQVEKRDRIIEGKETWNCCWCVRKGNVQPADIPLMSDNFRLTDDMSSQFVKIVLVDQ